MLVHLLWTAICTGDPISSAYRELMHIEGARDAPRVIAHNATHDLSFTTYRVDCCPGLGLHTIVADSMYSQAAEVPESQVSPVFLT